jgi:Ferritin-like domain
MGFHFLTAALLLNASLLASTTTAASLPQGVADTLNFALNLECLEAQFYSCAVYGKLSARMHTISLYNEPSCCL